MGIVLRTWRGFALPIALVAMVGSGGAVTAAFYALGSPSPPPPPAELVAHAERVASLGLEAARLDAAAGMMEVSGQPIIVYASGTGSARASYTIDVRILSDSTALVRSEGRAVADGTEAVRSVEAVVPLPGGAVDR